MVAYKLLNAIKHGIHVQGKVIIYLFVKYIEIDNKIGSIMERNSKLVTDILVFILFASIIGPGIPHPKTL